MLAPLPGCCAEVPSSKCQVQKKGKRRAWKEWGAVQARGSSVSRNPRGEPRGYMPAPLRGWRQARQGPIPSILSILVRIPGCSFSSLSILSLFPTSSTFPCFPSIPWFPLEWVAGSEEQPGKYRRFQDARHKSGETADASRVSWADHGLRASRLAPGKRQQAARTP